MINKWENYVFFKKVLRSFNSLNVHWYLWRKYAFIDKKKKMAGFVERKDVIYLWGKLRSQDAVNSGYPIVSKQYTNHLRQWTKGTRKSMRLAISVVWRKSNNHGDNCYFWNLNLKVWTGKIDKLLSLLIILPLLLYRFTQWRDSRCILQCFAPDNRIFITWRH